MRCPLIEARIEQTNGRSGMGIENTNTTGLIFVAWNASEPEIPSNSFAALRLRLQMVDFQRNPSDFQAAQAIAASPARIARDTLA
jgi:hypothetical protein